MGGTGKWTGKWGLRLLGAIDIALCLFIAYMHEAEEGTDKGMDSGAFKGRFKASFKSSSSVGSHSRDLAKCGVWIFTLEPSTSFFLL
jgi:hypothetical protein